MKSAAKVVVVPDHTLSFAERMERLSKKRSELIRPVQERPRDYVLLSIRDVAAKLGTDPATVLRTVRGLGFESYREFKAYLHQLSIASATSLDGMQAVSKPNSSLLSQGARALDQDLQNLQALRNTLDMNRIVAIARRVYAARKILVLGGDLAASLAEYLEYNLTLLGFTVVAGITPGKTINAVRSFDRHDLVFAISFRRGLRQTVEGMKQARANGAYCVGITDSFVSPICRFSDECLLASIESHLGTSYAAPMSLFNVMLTICAHYREARTMKTLKKLDQEQRHGYRWYPV
ncbi:transcriptional regulator, RpiR family [Candidatus Koribacter versatilis Ellin345]|uniref:Transcriptional regulator, RpiR family n=1 Tax=Koribacter versatilis (strain Ellin345) TaxID=204669 RepID=Q1IJ92_KORVE|nr:MurR/RpiR family transcriptional regulator [Candidatus Koribacter versatilis]ABF43058.1 transcriptional regulator, RpiR family [Candidatus Koribacter versatilis Ellin345]